MTIFILKVSLPRVQCQEVETEECISLPYPTMEKIELERCGSELGKLECTETVLTLPKQVRISLTRLNQIRFFFSRRFVRSTWSLIIHPPPLMQLLPPLTQLLFLLMMLPLLLTQLPPLLLMELQFMLLKLSSLDKETQFIFGNILN